MLASAPVTAEKAGLILQKYGEHPKYGRIIAAAVAGWMRHKVKAAPEVWGAESRSVRGLTPDSTTIQFPGQGPVPIQPGIVDGERTDYTLWQPSKRWDDGNCACIVAAAIFDLVSDKHGMVDTAREHYGLTYAEIWGLIEGFDDSPRGVGKPGYEIGKDIRNILLG